MNDEEALGHIGILGMRWGRRNSGSASSSKGSGKKKEDPKNSKSNQKGKTDDKNNDDVKGSTKKDDTADVVKGSGKKDNDSTINIIIKNDTESRNQAPRDQNPAPKQPQRDPGHAAVTVGKTKRLEDMSNRELREFAERVTLEKQYRDLTTTPKEKSMAKEFVESFAKQTAQSVATKLSQKAAEEVFKFIVGGQASNVVNNVVKAAKASL